MKVLWNNIAKSDLATYTSVSPDDNFPASNLFHQFLRLRYQSTATTDTITIDYDTAFNCDFFGYGYSNSIESVRLYNGVTLLKTIDAEPLQGVEVETFPTLSIDQIQIDLATGTADLCYLGGIGFGEAYSMLPPISRWEESYVDNSIVSVSKGGQVASEYIEPFRVYEFDFDGLTRTEGRAILTQYALYGKGAHVWVDFETDALDPMYAIINDSVKLKKNIMRYSYGLKLQEAR